MKTIYTIGFNAKNSCSSSLNALPAADVREVIDIPPAAIPHNWPGWSKYPDVAYLLTAGFGIHYEHHLEFAPTAELLATSTIRRTVGQTMSPSSNESCRPPIGE